MTGDSACSLPPSPSLPFLQPSSPCPCLVSVILSSFPPPCRASCPPCILPVPPPFWSCCPSPHLPPLSRSLSLSRLVSPPLLCLSRGRSFRITISLLLLRAVLFLSPSLLLLDPPFPCALLLALLPPPSALSCQRCVPSFHARLRAICAFALSVASFDSSSYALPIPLLYSSYILVLLSFVSDCAA